MITPKAVRGRAELGGDREAPRYSEAGQQREVHQVTHRCDAYDDQWRQQRTKSHGDHCHDHQHAGNLEQEQTRVEIAELGNLSRDKARHVRADIRLVLEVRGVPVGEPHLIAQARAGRNVQVGDGDICPAGRYRNRSRNGARFRRGA